MTSTATAPHATEYDNAILVLRRTNDGDDLSPRDLRLVEAVTNFGLARLAPSAQARWEQVVAMATNGTYRPDWLQGVEHLTKDHQGYVHWKGRVVEHYSFSDAAAEKVAAERLGRCCRHIEASGQQVDARKVLQTFDAELIGSGLGLRRWLVTWTTLKAGARLQVACVDTAADTVAALAEITASAAHERMREWGCARNMVRTALIATAEDLAALEGSFAQDCDWARRAVDWQQYATSAPLSELIAKVRRSIPAQDLPSAEQVSAMFYERGTTRGAGSTPDDDAPASEAPRG